MKKIQEELLKILKEIVLVLEENDINYWLAYGSVLGAVRHHGFIPWDDDIDIYIDGKDYDKVKEAFLKLDNERVSFHDFETVKGYPYAFPKIVNEKTELIETRFKDCNYHGGIYIDIFPLFSVSANRTKRKVDQFIRRFNYSIIQAVYYDESAEKRLKVRMLGKFLRLFNIDKAQQKLKRRYKKGIQNCSGLVQDGLKFTDRFLHKSKHFKGYEIVDFEGSSFRAPNDCDGYLKHEYGDYMALPPEEKRGIRHDFFSLKFEDEM